MLHQFNLQTLKILGPPLLFHIFNLFYIHVVRVTVSLLRLEYELFTICRDFPGWMLELGLGF